MVIILLPLVLVGVVLLLVSRLRRDGGPDVGWSTSAGVASPSALTPAAALERGSAPAIARALGRVESRQLVHGFSFAVGIAFSGMIVLVFGIVWSGDFEERWENIWILAPIFVYPLVGMTIVGVHAAVTRERRDGAAELFRSCPVPPALRTAAHLRTAWVPVMSILVFLGVFGLASLWRGSAFGSIPLRTAGDVLAALALGLGGTCLGVALARWAPWWPAPIVTIVLVGMVSIAISGIGEPGHWSQTRQLSTFPRYPDYDPVFAVRPVWWHLGWLLALCAAVAVIAVAHDRRDRRVLATGAVVIAALLVTGYATTRPLDAHEAERVASMVAYPERHQTCVERAGGAFCTYPGFEELRGMFADELTPVLAGLPDAAPQELVLRQRYDSPLRELDPEVRERLPNPLPQIDADVYLELSSHPDAFVAARLLTGVWAVGLPVDPAQGGIPRVIAGESSGVVALWIAARGLQPDDATDLASTRYNPEWDGPETAYMLGMAWPDPCEVGSAPVVWAAQDLTAARALLGLPEAEVRQQLDADWELLTDPTTTTAQLLEHFGLPGVGPIDDVHPDVSGCSY